CARPRQTRATACYQVFRSSMSTAHHCYGNFGGAFGAPNGGHGTHAAHFLEIGKNNPEMIKRTQTSVRTPVSSSLRLGFVPLTDCAPLVMAEELGLFRKFGLSVSLSRELGWATIRDKIIHRELDAAHAVAGMPFAATLGLGSIARDCLTGLVLNQH